MRALLIDPFGGLAGDMFLAALLDLSTRGEPGRDDLAGGLEAALRSLPYAGWTMRRETVTRRALAATRVRFEIPAERGERHLPEILEAIASSSLTARAKAWASASFRRLAEAEARVHGIPVERVHFHEVGAMDSILDICGVCFALDALEIDRVYCGEIPLGSGTMRCDHGEMPLPAPATLELLGGFGLRHNAARTEMVTPTAASLLAELARPLPAELRVRRLGIGYGGGTRELSVVRVTSAVCLDAEDALEPGFGRDEVWVLECALDDQSGESLAFSMQAMMDAGALDVAAAPIVMKKGRPGHALTVMCGDAERARMRGLLFELAGTLGLRETRVARVLAPRAIRVVQTAFGAVRVKCSGTRLAPEYEDCAELARAAGVALDRVYEAARRAAGEAQEAGGDD